MQIKNLFGQNKPIFSFEFFPPKTAEAESALYQTIERLKSLNPAFVSVTCGAMGTTREKTAELAVDIKQKLGTESMAHVTCVAFSKDEIYALLEDLKNRGVKNVLALRGDPPEGTVGFKRPVNGFAYARELVAFIREKFGNAFSIGVAGYPEGHPECSDKKADLIHLKEKVEAGADFVVSQLFFINDYFLKFRESAAKLGVRVPILPGIMPITSVKQIDIFAQKCGAKIPSEMRRKVESIGDANKEKLEEYGIEYATRQCEELLKAGVPGIHFYTLNRSKATRKIFENLHLA